MTADPVLPGFRAAREKVNGGGMTERFKYVDLVRKADGAHYPPFNELFQQLASARHSPEEWDKLLTWIAAGNAADHVSTLSGEKLERQQRVGGGCCSRYSPVRAFPCVILLGVATPRGKPPTFQLRPILALGYLVRRRSRRRNMDGPTEV